jgi:hypothetical protein
MTDDFATAVQYDATLPDDRRGITLPSAAALACQVLNLPNLLAGLAIQSH